MLAYKGKQLVRILRITETGAIALYEPVDEPGNLYMPLIENGKNVEEFKFIDQKKQRESGRVNENGIERKVKI